MWSLATFFVTLFLCQPIAFNWDTTIAGGKCGNTLASWKSTGIVNIITDVIILLVPIPSLCKVQMALYKKLVLIGVFALGVFTTAVGIARLVAIVNVDQTDITYSVAWAMVFSALECSVAVSLSCIPLLRPLLGRGTYSKNGTAKVKASWRGSRPTISGRPKNVFQRMDDDSLELELRPNGSEHRADVVHNKGSNIADGIDPPRGVEENIMVSHEWNVSSHEK
ncbi:hypothetical protein G7054_g6682 [Neopestalotiopsis clavispora]|nr:hypothetical protein G7054_g6682 [Neopestalotiopsis clavispora]